MARNTNSSFHVASFKNPITAFDHYITFFLNKKKTLFGCKEDFVSSEKCQKPAQYLRCRRTAIDIRGEMAFHLKKTDH